MDVYPTHGPGSLNFGGRYQLKVKSAATISTNTFTVYTSSTDPYSYATWAQTPFAVTGDLAFNLVLPGSTDRRFNHLALLAYAMWQYPVEATGRIFSVYEDAGPVTSEVGSYVRLGSTYPFDHKFRVARELGRLLTAYRDAGGADCSATYTDALDYCDSGITNPDVEYNLQRRMYQAAAACEGITDFYAALVWNDVVPGSLDCQYREEHSRDIDLDGIIEDGPLVPLVCSTHNFDWLEYWTLTNDSGGECEGTITARSTRYDWLQYFWEMRAVQGVPLDELWDLWDDANPHGWCPDDACVNLGQQPHERMQTYSSPYTTEHNAARDHGLDH